MITKERANNHYKSIYSSIFSRLKELLFSGNKRSNTVKKNIVALLFIRGCSIIVSLMLVPVTLGYISSELYGIWLTLSSIMLWLNFFDIGFTLGLKNKLAEAISLKDWERGKSLVSTTYFMMILIFIPLCLVLEAITPFINWTSFLNVNLVHQIDIGRSLHILIACFCLQMIVNILTSVISAYQKVALSSVFPVLGNFLSLIIIYILTKTCPPSLYSLALTISLMPIIVIIIASFILYHKKFKAIAPSVKYINKSYIKDLWNLGAKFFLIQVQVVILYQCTNILISNISGPKDVTAYNIAYKYLGVSMMVYSIILSPLWPAFTDAYTKRDFKWMNNIYHKMEKVYIASALILIIMILISPYIYHLWIGQKANIPFYMTVSVGVYMLIYSWNSLQVQLINGIGAIKLQTYVTLIGLAIHIPLSIIVGKYLGAIGVILSMIIINTIYVCLFTIQIHKILNKKAKKIWIE